MTNYKNNTNAISVHMVKVTECDIVFGQPKLRKNEYRFGLETKQIRWRIVVTKWIKNYLSQFFWRV